MAGRKLNEQLFEVEDEGDGGKDLGVHVQLLQEAA